MRHDLPGKAEAVPAPAAGNLHPAATGDGVPVAVGFLLRVGEDLEGHRLVEGDVRAAVQADEGLAEDGEFDRQFLAFAGRGIVGGRGERGSTWLIGKVAA